MKNQKGFTLIELLVVIGIIAILASVVIVAINPARQFAQARNTQRASNVNAILNGIGQNMADNRGIWNCGVALPTATATIIGVNTLDIASCLVPDYLPSLPFDPETGSWTSASDYTTGYTVIVDADGRVTVAAPQTDIPPASTTISITR